ncbi:hypothetical protein B0H17DRAFT_1295287 [Mycena rosella]|uniref:Uncharacterized protein n=1 Tax=Mycena rosella TaxID=1033263 RepID=A0AAD7DF29_MYCRO|nr:hypothetical protein B0H17DRAFT_1295287 [Mycena rosella]
MRQDQPWATATPEGNAGDEVLEIKRAEVLEDTWLIWLFNDRSSMASQTLQNQCSRSRIRNDASGNQTIATCMDQQQNTESSLRRTIHEEEVHKCCEVHGAEDECSDSPRRYSPAAKAKHEVKRTNVHGTALRASDNGIPPRHKSNTGRGFNKQRPQDAAGLVDEKHTKSHRTAAQRYKGRRNPNCHLVGKSRTADPYYLNAWRRTRSTQETPNTKLKNEGK